MKSNSLTITREHALGVEEARRRVDKIAEEMGSRLKLTAEWEGDHLRVTGTGVSGHIAIAEDNVEIHITMAITMIMFREPIRSAIESSIDHYID